MTDERRVIVEGLGGAIGIEALVLFLESSDCPQGGEVDFEASELGPNGKKALIVFEDKEAAYSVLQNRYCFGGKELKIKTWYNTWKEESVGANKHPKVRYYIIDYEPLPDAHESHMSPIDREEGSIKEKVLSLKDHSREPTSYVVDEDNRDEEQFHSLGSVSCPDIDEEKTGVNTAAFMSMPPMPEKRLQGSGVLHHDEEEVSEDIPIQEYYIDLLNKLIHRDFKLRATVQKIEGGFKITGQKSAFVEAKLKIYEIIQKSEVEFITHMSPTVLKMVTMSPCYDELLQVFSNRQLDACLFYGNDQARIVAIDSNTATACQKLLHEEVSHKTICLDKKVEDLTGTDEWDDILRDQRTSPKVHIYIETIDTTVIHVEGMSEAVNRIHATLNTFLETADVTEQLQLNPTEWRLLKERLDLKSLLPRGNLKYYQRVRWSFEVNGKGANKVLQITGPIGQIEKCRKDIEDVLSTVKDENVTYCKPGLTQKLLTENPGKQRLGFIEQEHHCTIDITSQEHGASSIASRKPHHGPYSLGAEGVDPSDCPGPTPMLKASSRHRTKAKVDQGPVALAKGDLSEFKSDVLVCTVVHKKHELSKAGAVAKGFANKGGQELETAYSTVCSEYERNVLPLGDVYMTPKTGDLQCNYVIFVPLKEWKGRDRHAMNETVKRLLYKCLELVREKKQTSVAFPTIGCGNLKFPASEVAKCFAEVVPHSLRLNACDTKVTLVSFDEGNYREFEAVLHPRPSLKPEPRRKTPGRSEYRDENRRILAKLPTIIFHIHAVETEKLNKVKEEIDCLISDLVNELRYTKEYLKHIDDEEHARLLQLGDGCVETYLDTVVGELVIAGEKKTLLKFQPSVEKALALVEKRLKDPKVVRSLKGDGAYLVALAREATTLPSYWSVSTGVGAQISQIKGYFTTDQKLTKVDQKLFHAIKKLMETCWDTSRVGAGKDARGLSHTSFKIKNISINQNPTLYISYRSYLKKVCNDVGRGLTKVQKVTDLSGEADVLTAVNGVAELDAIRIPQANEFFLFHGAPGDVKDAIAKQGLDFRLAGRGLFGGGIYFAESSTKADQYADRGDRSEGSKYMYICRVVIRDPFLCKIPKEFKRPPCNGDGCHSETCQQHDYHDSVIGVGKDKAGTRLLFREFIVYDKDSCYPEFLIEYERA